MKILNNTYNYKILKPKEKQEKTGYVDPLKTWPLIGLSYTSDIGAVVGELNPKLGNMLRVPTLMYFGADIYDKYKNENDSYNPSAKRGVKQAITQAAASVILPSFAVGIGQRIFSSCNRISKTGLTTQAKEDILNQSLAYMKSCKISDFSDFNSYKNKLNESLINLSKDKKHDFISMPLYKKIPEVLNPLKNFDNIAFSNPKRIVDYSSKFTKKIFNIHNSLLKNEKPKELSNRAYKQFVQLSNVCTNGALDKESAAKQALKNYHKIKIFQNKLIKVTGGFIALAILSKPIERFVDKYIIKKTVEPGLDFISNSFNGVKVKYSDFDFNSQNND